MKNLIYLFILFLIASPVFALTDSKGVPQWSEFCPEQYLNAEYKNYNDVDYKAMATMPYCKSNKKWVKVVNAVTVLPAVDCWCGEQVRRSAVYKEFNSFNNNLYYWNKRKSEFDANMTTCNQMDKNGRAMCYLKVRDMEAQKNKDLEQAAYNKAMLRQQQIMNTNQSLQLMNINQNLNNLNNTIRYGY